MYSGISKICVLTPGVILFKHISNLFISFCARACATLQGVLQMASKDPNKLFTFPGSKYCKEEKQPVV